eukprot:5203789-Pyramimonas_sp.AAC.2
MIVVSPPPRGEVGRISPSGNLKAKSPPSSGVRVVRTRCTPELRTGLGSVRGTRTLHTELAPGNPGCSIPC